MKYTAARKLGLVDLPLSSPVPMTVYIRRLALLLKGALLAAAACLYAAVWILAVQVGSPWVQVASMATFAIVTFAFVIVIRTKIAMSPLGFGARLRRMRLSRRSLWLWVGLLLIIATTAGVLAVPYFSNWNSAAAPFYTPVVVAIAVAGVITVAVEQLTAVRIPLSYRLEDPGELLQRVADEPAEQLRRVTDELAEQLRRQWEQVSTERGLIYPRSIPVQWRYSLQPVTSPITEVVEGPFAPLPGIGAVTVADLQSGAVSDLLRVYGGLGSGRLIILGEPGAGKSAAGIRLLLDALTHRATLIPEDRVRAPVPVLVTPQGWDPTTEPFTTWLADRLARDYPLLRAPEYGGYAAMRLILGGQLAVILDGLDEIPEALRSVALQALDKQAAFRLVVLTRPDELETAAVRGGHLRGAAALELLPIDPRQAAEYLGSCQHDPPPRPWQHVIGHLREHPEGVLAQTLTTPLMLTLLRDTYRPGDAVDELLDGNRFPTREAVEDHLLDRVMTAAYTRHPGRAAPPYTVYQARRWLGQLAHRMNQERTRDLAWWRIPRWVPAWPRVFFTVVILSLVSAFIAGSLAGFIAHTHLLSAFHARPLAALAAVFSNTLGYAFMFGTGLLLMSPPGDRFPLQRDRLRWSRANVRMILLLGLGVGAGAGLEKGLLSGLKYGLTVGLMSSFVVGLGFVLGGGPPQRLGRLQWNRIDNRANLHTGLAVGLIYGLATGFAYGFGYGLRYGLMYGFIVGIGYLLVILVGGRPLSRSDLLRESGNNALAILLSGLVIGTVSAPGYGVIYVLIVILGGRPPLPRNRLRWDRTAAPTALLTGLAVGLVYGIVFWLIGGLVIGLVYGFVFWLIGGFLLGLRQSPAEATSPLDPPSLWRRERQLGLGFGLVAGLLFGLAVGLVAGLVYGFTDGLVYGLTGGLVAGLGTGLVSSATWATALASAQLRHRDKAPARLLRFLDDARQRQILRAVGPVYQFRDARLQDRLAEAYVFAGRAKGLDTGRFR